MQFSYTDMLFFFFFKQKTAYEIDMDWSSDVCSSDLVDAAGVLMVVEVVSPGRRNIERDRVRKRREYARADIPLYIIIDDFDEGGAVLILSEPDYKIGRASCRV